MTKLTHMPLDRELKARLKAISDLKREIDLKKAALDTLRNDLLGHISDGKKASLYGIEASMSQRRTLKERAFAKKYPHEEYPHLWDPKPQSLSFLDRHLGKEVVDEVCEMVVSPRLAWVRGGAPQPRDLSAEELLLGVDPLTGEIK